MGPQVKGRVFAFAAPVDMRKGIEALGGLLQPGGARELLRGDVYLFTGRCRRRAKVLYFDGTGLCLLSKRLEQGRFARLWRTPEQGPLQLSLTELELFLEGSEVVGQQALSPPEMDDKMLAVRAPM